MEKSERLQDLRECLNRYLAETGLEKHIPQMVAGREAQKHVRDAVAEVLSDVRHLLRDVGVPYSDVDHIAEVMFRRDAMPGCFEN